jgi:hypothetical protein
MAAGLTDLFGDVPYFTAFNGGEQRRSNTSLGLQESIYMNENGILILGQGNCCNQNYNDAIRQGDIYTTEIYNLGSVLQSIKN